MLIILGKNTARKKYIIKKPFEIAFDIDIDLSIIVDHSHSTFLYSYLILYIHK